MPAVVPLVGVWVCGAVPLLSTAISAWPATHTHTRSAKHTVAVWPANHSVALHGWLTKRKLYCIAGKAHSCTVL